MKKLLIVFSVFLSLFLFTACERDDNGKDENEVEIEATELTGSGTLSDPFKINIEFEGSQEVSFLVSDDETLSFEVGELVDEKFEKLGSLGIPNIEVVKTATKNSFHVNSLDTGVALVRFFVGNSEVFLEVTIDELPVVDYSKQFKVLSIGNSYSEDAMEYLYDIAADYGVEEIVIGYLYIGSASLQLHYQNADSNNGAYLYRKNDSGAWTETQSTTILTALTDEDWDLITLQQQSGNSGVASSYDPYLDLLISYVNDNKTNSQAKLAWHMTWAYQQDTNHGDFSNYNNNQIDMYDSIVEVIEDVVSRRQEISLVIPVGTSIQNLRTSFYGDTLTRDGYHLSLGAGRYAAALTFFGSVTGFDISDIMFTPSQLSENSIAAIKESVNNALENPFEVFASTYTEVEERDDSFGRHHQVGYGNPSNVVWNEDLEAWFLSKTSALESAAHYYLDKPTAGEAYTWSADILMRDATNNAGEFVIELVNSDSHAIRLVLRLENGQYVLFTDYRNPGFSGYQKLNQFQNFDEPVNIKIEKTANQYKIYFNDIMVLDKEFNFGSTQVVIGAVHTEVLVTNIESLVITE